MRILFSLLFLVNIVYASVAVVSAFKGDANIYREGQEIDVHVGIEVNKNDNLKTFNNTKLQLIFKDNTRITIGKNSQFSVENYFYDEANPSVSKAKFKFTKGLFRTISGRIGKLNKKQFKIIVKNATIGIRGTVFDVFVSNEYTKVGVYDGEVYFENNKNITNIKSNEYFIYENITDKRILKNGKFKESFEFDDKKSDKYIKTKNTKNTPKLSTNNPNNPTSGIKNEVNNIVNAKEINTEPQLIKEIIDDGVSLNDVPDLDYGYWQDPINDNKRIDTFIDGIKTVTSVINSKSGTATYKGQIASIVTDLDGVKVDRGGTIDLNVDFGENSINGTIEINSGQYRVEFFDASISNSEFSTTDIYSNGDIEVQSGSINGKFYGNNGDSIGGDFILNGADTSVVDGSYGAEIQ